MNRTALIASVLGALCSSACLVAADSETGDKTTSSDAEICIIDIEIVATNRVRIGTNTMSTAAATDVVAKMRGKLDVVALHGAEAGDDALENKSEVITRIARAGMPLVVVERDGEYSWREQSGGDGVRTVKIDTEQFAVLRRFWQKGNDNGAKSAGPVLRTSLDWDTATGTYELSRIELGLFGKKVWLMHEQRESSEDSETIGIQLKREW